MRNLFGRANVPRFPLSYRKNIYEIYLDALVVLIPVSVIVTIIVNSR